MSLFTEDKIIICNLEVADRLDQYLGFLRRDKIVCEQRVAPGPDRSESEILFDKYFPVMEYDRDAMRLYHIFVRFNGAGQPMQQDIIGYANGWTKYPAYDLIEGLLYHQDWELLSRTKNAEDANDLADTFIFKHRHKPFEVVSTSGTGVIISNMDLV